MEISEYIVVQSIVDGNEYEFSIIFNEYKKLVYSIALKFLNNISDVEDICQEVFLRIFNSLKKFNPEYRLSTWITKITKNLCINKLKSQKIRPGSIDELELAKTVLSSDITPEKIIIEDETVKCLHSVVMELPLMYREPVILFYFEGLQYNEIANLLNVPMSIVKNRIYRAKIILKSKITNHSLV